jgi:hypothetical protein
MSDAEIAKAAREWFLERIAARKEPDVLNSFRRSSDADDRLGKIVAASLRIEPPT